MTADTTLDHVRAVADAVLYEGYVLYPYRASAAKNRARWQFGVLVPPSYAATGTGEHAACRTECLAEVGPDAELTVRLRFLQAQRRTVEVEQADEPGRYREVDALVVGEDELLPWDEAVECEQQVTLPVRRLLASEQYVPVIVRGGAVTTTVEGGRVLRQKQPLTAELRCRAERLPGLVRLHVTVANTATIDCTDHSRDEALRHSLIAAHTVLSLSGGRFLSLLEPPDWAREAGKGCVNEHTWPVLAGPPGSDDTMLSSPIILYDHPKVDPGSHGDFFDACEIDEMLTLRTLTLTDEEKREARATDERARRIVDRVEDLPSQPRESMQGRVRIVRLGGQEIGTGSKVVLRPRTNGDAQDMFVAGRVATVRSVLEDVDGTCFLAVTVDGDPAEEWQLAQGRFRYFTTTEVEPYPGEVRP
ncbi:hypothetical protein B1813_18560 [Saccharomonospora piscinae]|uniref:Uncharacterized protein n=1 Tax=Saccharomonospora piscinae TaxID=687388 RepID=A0A1V8ZYI9_SACPI|nr:hypothetical protein [Saccharomonospora piscinae]OQO89851.1 hypothetical protein B1813_18560 [Saccharomonospora piscinae]TLW90627.1 hypothetical protein FFT09_19960 [Saccharomonospora piscinae]